MLNDYVFWPLFMCNLIFFLYPQVRSNNPSIVIPHGQTLESYTFHNKNHGFLRDPPIPLFNPSVTVLDNFMYACGGKYDSAENNEIATARCFRYDPRLVEPYCGLCIMKRK